MIDFKAIVDEYVAEKSWLSGQVSLDAEMRAFFCDFNDTQYSKNNTKNVSVYT